MLNRARHSQRSNWMEGRDSHSSREWSLEEPDDMYCVS